MNMNESQSPERNLETRYRTLLTLWGVNLSSLGLFFLLSRLVETPRADQAPDDVLGWLLLAVGALTVLVSFVIKSRVLSQAVERQDLARVQVAYVIGFALCEMAGICGLGLYFLRGASSAYYLLFALAALGMLLHFPRRSHLTDASFKRGGFGASEF